MSGVSNESDGGATSRRSVLCCAVLCCDILCYAMLCYAVLYSTLLRFEMASYVTLRVYDDATATTQSNTHSSFAKLYYAILWWTIIHCAAAITPAKDGQELPQECSS